MNNLPYYTILVVSLLITIIIIFFIVSILRYHRQYIRMQKERILAEITMQEIERKRIVSDLHDSLGPLLSTVKLNINSIDARDKEEKEIIEKAGKHLDEIISSIRQISYNLFPNTLERKGLTEALKEFAQQMNSNRDIKIDIEIENDFSLPRSRQIHVFRILQEIVHNTIKHAKAKHLQITFNREKDNLFIYTRDDGSGFDIPKTRSDSKGLGLMSLESRTEILDAKLKIESKPGSGTGYFIQIPLSPYAHET